jgi:hypothetical protein
VTLRDLKRADKSNSVRDFFFHQPHCDAGHSMKSSTMLANCLFSIPSFNSAYLQVNISKWGNGRSFWHRPEQLSRLLPHDLVTQRPRQAPSVIFCSFISIGVVFATSKAMHAPGNPYRSPCYHTRMLRESLIGGN